METSTVSDNSAALGGGLHLNDSSATLVDSTVSDNSAEEGGGLHLYYYSDATLNDATVSDNTAYDGGGLYLYSSSASVSASDFLDNVDDDLYHSDTSTSYDFGVEASFECDDSGCE